MNKTLTLNQIAKICDDNGFVFLSKTEHNAFTKAFWNLSEELKRMTKSRDLWMKKYKERKSKHL